MTDFDAIVRAASRLYFDEILPRFIDRDLRGRGYAFVWQMLHDHDRDAVFDILSEPEPSQRARTMARAAEAQCPLFVRHGPTDRFGDFQRVDHFVQTGTTDFRELGSEFVVRLYRQAFVPLADDPDRLCREVTLTIFHEYIHYFESFLPASERPLAERERGVEIPRLTPEAARRRDTWFLARRYALWGVVVAGTAVLAVVLAVTFG